MVKPDGEDAGRGKQPEQLRLSVFFVAIFLIVGSYMPFMPVWLASRGLSADAIALALALPLVLRPLIAPAIGLWADATGSYRAVSVALAVGALAALVFLSQASGFWLIALWLTLYSLLWKAQVPLADTIAIGAAARGAHYGRMRLWGSLSFVVATFCAGAALDHVGPGAAMGVLAIASMCVLLAALALPNAPPADPDAARPAASGLRGLSRDFRDAAAGSGFWVFLLATAAIQASHATYYTFGTVHWLSLGASGTGVGVLWTIGVLAEVALFAASGPVLRAISPLGLIALAGVAGCIRWLAMAFDPPWAAVAGLQLLHGLTYGAAHLGAMFFIARAFPVRFAGTAQAIYGSITAGLGMAIATAAIGPAYRDWGAFAYLPMVGLGALASLLAVWLMARAGGPFAQPHTSGAGGDTRAPS